MKRAVRLCVPMICVAVGLATGTGLRAEDVPQPGATVQAEEVIIQIGGRFCEYHSEDVEQALRRFDVLQQVEFLNNHGTVLVRYQRGAIPPRQLAESVERSLAMGWGCKA